MIDADHPLKDTLIWVALPFLKPCKRKIPKFIPNQEDDTDEGEDQSDGSNAQDKDTNDPFATDDHVERLI